MKYKQAGKTAIAMLAAGVIMSLLLTCSGVVGGTGSVVLSLPSPENTGASRHVDSRANGVDVFIMRENSPAEFRRYAGRGPLYIDQLIPGNYVFLIFLHGPVDGTASKDLGFAVKEIAVEPGVNTLDVTVLPAIEWEDSSSPPFLLIRNLLLWENLDIDITGTPVIEYGTDQMTVGGVPLSQDQALAMRHPEFVGGLGDDGWVCYVDILVNDLLFNFKEYGESRGTFKVTFLEGVG